MDDLMFLFDPSSQIYQIIAGTFLGAFVGLRREMEQQKLGQKSFMGFRTTALLVLLGVVSVFFPKMPYLPLISFVGIFVFLFIIYYNGVFKLNLIGLTSEFTTLLMFWVGVLVGSGEMILAIVLTTAVALLNAYKQKMHSFAKNFSLKEWTGTLQLIIVSALVLPFLPREAIDPLGIFVPFKIWLLVILISGISFLGYFMNKYLGTKKGIFLTAFLGAIASSTAVTTSFATRVKEVKNQKILNIFRTGILISIFTMMLRVIFLIFYVGSEPLFFEVFIPILAMLIAALLLALISFVFSKKDADRESIDPDLKIQSPFELLPALKFGVLFSLILLAVFLGNKYFGNLGVYVTSFFSGLVDVDAATLSALEAFSKNQLDLSVAGNAIVLVVIINTVVKIFYVWSASSKAFTRKVFIPISLISLVGLFSWLVF